MRTRSQAYHARSFEEYQKKMDIGDREQKYRRRVAPPASGEKKGANTQFIETLDDYILHSDTKTNLHEFIQQTEGTPELEGGGGGDGSGGGGGGGSSNQHNETQKKQSGAVKKKRCGSKGSSESVDSLLSGNSNSNSGGGEDSDSDSDDSSGSSDNGDSPTHSHGRNENGGHKSHDNDDDGDDDDNENGLGNKRKIDAEEYDEIAHQVKRMIMIVGSERVGKGTLRQHLFDRCACTDGDGAAPQGALLTAQPSTILNQPLDFRISRAKSPVTGRTEIYHVWLQNLTVHQNVEIVENCYYPIVEIFIFIYNYGVKESVSDLTACLEKIKAVRQNGLYSILIGVGEANDTAIEQQAEAFAENCNFFIKIKSIEDDRQELQKILSRIQNYAPKTVAVKNAKAK